VLEELRVENLLLLERAELRLVDGLNVLTGETGAGKTLLAQALDLLLGGRARAGIVRQGAGEAYVEGVFTLPTDLDGELRERLPADAGELVLARRVWPDGRTRAYLCGRSATLADLRAVGERLISFYGQHEHRRLMLGATQLELLDRHCGREALSLRACLTRAHERRAELAARRRQLLELAGARERELDLARFELAEIEAAAPQEDEREQLAAERERLRHLEALQSAVTGGLRALAAEEEELAGAGAIGALAALGAAERALRAGAAIDPDLGSYAERACSLAYEAQDMAGELRGYLDRLQGSATPGRLELVEERLELLGRLERKHGGDVGAVLAHAERCRARIAELEGAEDALAQVEGELEVAERELAGLAERLSAVRARGAPALAGAVRARLAELALGHARFDIALGRREQGIGRRGADTVELLLSAGPGLAPAPLREIASGGELSRVMLALLSVAHSAAPAGDRATVGRDGASVGRDGASVGRDGASAEDATPQRVLVFDEIDAGIGGRTARSVARHLRELAKGNQIICITHLPQVAAAAQRHFTIAKDLTSSAARTTVNELCDAEVVAELVRMLGAEDGDRAASRHARELLRAA